jgi:hypothetical protein
MQLDLFSDDASEYARQLLLSLKEDRKKLVAYNGDSRRSALWYLNEAALEELEDQAIACNLDIHCRVLIELDCLRNTTLYQKKKLESLQNRLQAVTKYYLWALVFGVVVFGGLISILATKILE